MVDDRKTPPSNPSLPREFAAAMERAHASAGKRLLTDEELIDLACGQIARTYTFEEKGYLQSS